jgi:hypothetical protein
MKSFLAVYNMKTSIFLPPRVMPTKADINASDDYMCVGLIEAENFDHVYRILNCDHPDDVVEMVNKLGVADPFHTKYPSLHTSISCGDVLVDTSDDSYYMCDACGWTKLEEK